MIKINASKCPKDHKCPVIEMCPVQAISQKNTKSAPVIDAKKCIECQLCVSSCGHGAFESH